MSATQVRTDIKNDLQLFIDANHPNTPLIDDPNDFRARDNINDIDADLWLSVLFYEDDTVQASIGPQGSRMWRETGVITLSVYVPSGEGDSELLSVIDSLKSRYRGVTIGDTVCESVSGPDVSIGSDAQSSRGNWFGYSLDIEYRFDYCD